MLMAPKSSDLGVIKAAIGASRFTLGLSYHVHVFGLSQGVPAIIVYSNDYYRYKSEGLVGFYAPPNAAVDVGADNGEAGAMRAIEELARNWIHALGGTVEGESPKESKKQMERLDFGGVLKNLEAADKDRAERLQKIKEIEAKRLQEQQDAYARQGRE